MEWIGEVAKVIKDPALLILLLVVAGLFYMLCQKEKQLVKLIQTINDNNVLMSKLTTMVEVLIYGQRGSKND